MDNPNEYHDGQWAQFSSEFQTTVGAFWEAGATVEEIRDAIVNGLADVGTNADVTLEIDPGGTPEPQVVRQPKPKRKR